MINMNRRRFCTALAGGAMPLYFPAMSRSLFAQAEPVQLTSGDHELALHAPFYSPFYEWPRTLLSYPVVLGQGASAKGKLKCMETGETVPFQITPARTGEPHAELLFFSDLPAGATRTFRYSGADIGPQTPSSTHVTVAKAGDRYTIDLGSLQVRIPASQTVSGDAPGPILELCRDGKWTGSSSLKIPGHPITAITTEQTEEGPLRVSHRITYTTQTGFKYVALIQCTAGAEFIRFEEEMESFPADVLGEFDFAWTGCNFTRRQAPNHPYNFPNTAKPSYQDYPWEEIAPGQMPTQFGVSPGISSSGDLPFTARTFEAWADVGAATFSNFWADSEPHAAGLFIDRPELWEDHEYSIWHSSERLSVSFVYKQSTLHFVWKLGRGSRSCCVAFYDHARDIEAMDRIGRLSKGVRGTDGEMYRGNIFSTSHMLNVQNWQGTLSLNKVKDWSTSYSKGASAKPLFKVVRYKNAREFYLAISQGFIHALALGGVRQNSGFGPTSSREILDSWVPGYQVFESQLTPDQKRQIIGMMLVMAYVHSGEDYMPSQRMLSGHPNFLSDVKSVPSGAAFLFPDHPHADTWADEYEAYLRLNTHFHTRPAVDEWEAKGGRWTENLGTYVWAFLRPSLRAAALFKARDGYERFTTPQLMMVGDWLVNALSAPFAGESATTMKYVKEQSDINEGHKRHYWGIVDGSEGPRRIHPPIGAHSERRRTPRAMWYMGSILRNYSPLVGEHLMWASRPTDQDMETPLDQPDPYAATFQQVDNHGTNPHLRSSKYTGYGFTLRTAVDTPKELSVHLLQIDDGQNYRWSNGSEGTCGILYFYANGKGYSHNGTEDAGDRIDQDTDVATNFGVWKDGHFKAIGQNVLTQPLYDLTFAQFAELVPRQGPNAYSWPEYVSRSVMLAGDDYFILYDHVFDPQIAHRFSWFVRKGDAFPFITLLTSTRNNESEYMTSVETATTSGRWSDGYGDSIALITHKEGIKAERTPYGGRVHLPGGTDLFFTAGNTVDVHEGPNTFTGKSGIIRNRPDGLELALFRGTHISAGGFSLDTSDETLGISARIPKSGPAFGQYFSRKPSEVTVTVPKNSGSLVFYIDGERTADAGSNAKIAIKLPAGSHRWELTNGMPVPLAPVIERTEYVSGGATIFAKVVSSASNYDLEISSDNAATWKSAGSAADGVFKVSGLENGKKYHVRATAVNKSNRSAAGPEYPLYVTQTTPLPPDGLNVELHQGKAIIRWGEMLGVTEYRLYRKKRDAEFKMVCSGQTTTWEDNDADILPPNHSPSDSLPDHRSDKTSAIQYYVTAVNHNGESHPSRTSNIDPSSWRNWFPADGGPYRRTFQLLEGPLPNDGIGRYYPGSGD